MNFHRWHYVVIHRRLRKLEQRFKSMQRPNGRGRVNYDPHRVDLQRVRLVLFNTLNGTAV